MLNIKRILLPVDFPNASLGVVYQAATLAHHFHAEIVTLHAATIQSHAAGVPESGPKLADWNILMEVLRSVPKHLSSSLRQELEGLTIKCVVAEGDPAQAIMRTAQEEKVDLIMMPSHGFTFNQFLLGSVTAKVLNGTECPVWTGAHAQGSWAEKYVIRSVLCAVDFRSHSHKTVSWAAQMAGEFGARLTLAHVTGRVETLGPGAARSMRNGRKRSWAMLRGIWQSSRRTWGSKQTCLLAVVTCPTCSRKPQKNEGGLAGYRVASLWWPPANPRLPNYLLCTDSSAERVR